MASEIVLILSSVSSIVRWVALDPVGDRIIGTRAWTDDQTRALSDSIGRELHAMCLDLSSVVRLAVVTGPGAFTGLRMGVAFAMGLARGLSVPLVGISTWSLFGRDVFIPTRQQRVKKMPFIDCLASHEEFFHLIGPREVLLETPESSSYVVGSAERPDWPSAHELVKGFREARESPAALQIFYGLEPKISGQRS